MKILPKICLAFLLLSMVSAHAQKSVAGSYILTKIITENEVDTSFTPVRFTGEGKILITNIPFGTWKANGRKVALEFMKPELNGLYTRKKKKGFLILQNKKNTFYFQKYNPEDNQKLPVLGVWKQLDTPESLYVKFALPDKIVSVKNQVDYTETDKGTWLYVPKDKTLMIFGLMDEMRGKGKLQSFTENRFTFTIDTLSMTFKRVKEAQPELLSFKEADFPEDIDDSGKLPSSWREYNDLKANLQNITSVTYIKNELLAEVGVFKTDTLAEKVAIDDKYIKITRYLLKGKDSTQLQEVLKGGLYNRYNPFYPQVEIGPYKVVDKEEITVPAGTFNCTVVEGFDLDKRYKFWLIDDKPGIFAKIIMELSSSDDDELKYRQYTLSKIQ